MIDITKFNSRLEKIINYYELSASAFSEKISVQRSSISHIISGRNKPSLDFIDKVIRAYPEIDLIWLLSGVGKFPLNTTQPQTSTEHLISKSPSLVNVKNTRSEIIDRIVIFYQDGSFENYTTNS